MPSTTLRFSARAHGCVAGLLLLVPLLLGADDYLREIEEEAKRQAPSLVIDPSSPAPGTTAVGDTTTDRLAAGLDQVAFEQALRENLPGTYAFYQQLGPDQRKQVYETYRSDNRFASISEQVARLLSGKH